jgi:outer membrane protein OmpA-like peptidoglycan-associated protein
MTLRSVLLCGALASTILAAPAFGQSFGDLIGDTIKRATRDEVRRKADKETRDAVRCVLGSADCETEQQSSNPDGTDAGGESGFALTPYPGSVPNKSSPLNNRVEAYTEYQRIIASSGTSMSRNSRETQRLEGRLTVREYRNPKGRSSFEIERNYLAALQGKGFAVDFSCAGNQQCGWPGYGDTWGEINGLSVGADKNLRYFTGSAMGETGRVYVSVAVTTKSHFIHILETTSMDSGLVAASGLAAGLERDGRVDLSGVFFDTGRATLRPESEATLAEVAQLMQAQPALRLNVVGHTDSVGNFNANMTLSRARAEAVRAALVSRYGIDGRRLAAIGRGSTEPVAGNETEAGRARNRRVELVRQ